MKIFQLHVPMDPVGVSCFGWLRRCTQLLHPRVYRIGCDSVMRTHIFMNVWFYREYFEALLTVTIIVHAFLPMVKSTGGECDGS
jgi:hypothetical protein